MTYPAMIGRTRQSTYLQAVNRASNPALNFGASITWTNMPLALSDLYSGTGSNENMKEGYASLPLIYNNFGNLSINIGATPGSANSVVLVQYSIDGGVNYTTIPNSSVSISSSGQKFVTFPIPEDAKHINDCFIRVMGQGGDGAADPIFAVNAGADAISWGVQPINLNINLDPPIFSSLTSKKRQMVFFNFFWAFSTLTWTNMPAALTEWFGVTTRRLTCNFFNPGSDMVKLAFNMSAAGSANAVMMMQYSLNAGATWQFIDSETTNTGAPCNIGALGFRQSASFVKVDAAAKVLGGTLCRLVGQNGDGAADPTFTGGQTGRTICCRFDPAS